MLLDLVETALDWSAPREVREWAGLRASLLVERAWSGVSCAGVLEEPLLSYVPGADEIDEALARTRRVLAVEPLPPIAVVRILTRSNRPEIVPDLVSLFARGVDGGLEGRALALQTLQAMAFTVPGSNRALFERAAAEPDGDLRDFARACLAASPFAEPTDP